MHGVYLLWWVQERGVSPAAVAAILAAGDFALTALEIPTGWVADRYGHRVSLIAGSALQVVGMLSCWLASGVPGLLTASLLVALGDAFRSGADQALLYRSCRALDREADFQRIEAGTRAATLAALVVLTISGGVIVESVGFAAGWIAETALAIVGLVIACVMVEPPADAVGAASAPHDGSSAPPSTRHDSLRIARLAAVIAPASLLGAAAGATAFVAQAARCATPAGTTLLIATVTLAEAAGALLAKRLWADLRLQLGLCGLGILILGAALLYTSAFVPAVVGLSALLGVAEPLRAAIIQRLSADRVRARAASLASACDKLFATVALIIAGTVPRR